MATVSAPTARKHLTRLIRQVNDDGEPVVITSRHGDAVLLAATEYRAIEETAHLLRSPANARHLFESLAQAQAGEAADHNLIR
jgi:antitoxin YefM